MVLRVVTLEGRTRAKCLAHLLLLPAQGCRLVCLVKGKRRKFGSVISEGVVNAKTGCWMLSTELNINGNGSV